MTRLPRGGLHVATVTQPQPNGSDVTLKLTVTVTLTLANPNPNQVHGAVQFGIPPETIKDSITRFGSPPHIYVVPQQRFHLASGINVCEFEFATYFNFFVKGKPITLVCYPNQGEVLRKIADEIIEGPPDRERFFQVRLRVRVRVRVNWLTLTLTRTQPGREYAPDVDPAVFAARPDLYGVQHFIAPRPGILHLERQRRAHRRARAGGRARGAQLPTELTRTLTLTLILALTLTNP